MYKICDCCGKRFFLGWEVNMSQYKYKQLVMAKNKERKYQNKDKYDYYCSYTCWRKMTPNGVQRYKRL